MKIAVTGAAGFIGSHLAENFLRGDHEVLGLDNLSTGLEEFLAPSLKFPKFRFEKLELLESDQVHRVLKFFAPALVLHLAANADVRRGLEHPRKDLEQGTLVTFNVLEGARAAGVSRFGYTSTGSVYGEPQIFPTPENCPFPVQTSLYAASKLAGEALIQAYCEGYKMQGCIFRFVSILGERYTHGHVLDFIRKLKINPKQIEVLGNGKQRKAYLDVSDCVAAIQTILSKTSERVAIYNVGPDEYLNVDQSLDVLCKIMRVSPRRAYSGGERGWIGDSPFIFLDCQKLRGLGWRPRLSIVESVERTARFLLANEWLVKLIEARETEARDKT
ncbi:MAG: nucleoside-diphosphate sugar epimerase [Bdellovibrio sp.]|nr:MAG: nucleoside-diphosphate sugar epimerase [Bdellovibrio sp.]